MHRQFQLARRPSFFERKSLSVCSMFASKDAAPRPRPRSTFPRKDTGRNAIYPRLRIMINVRWTIVCEWAAVTFAFVDRLRVIQALTDMAIAQVAASAPVRLLRNIPRTDDCDTDDHHQRSA